MPKLKNLVARLYRAIPDSYRHMTVYGNQEYTTFKCVACGQTGFLSEAYLKSKRDMRHGSDIRPYHASCYNETNGKFTDNPSNKRRGKSKEATATLLDFIME